MSEASSTKTRLGSTWTVTDFPDVFAKTAAGRTNGSGRGKVEGFRTINAAGDELIRPNLSRRFR